MDKREEFLAGLRTIINDVAAYEVPYYYDEYGYEHAELQLEKDKYDDLDEKLTKFIDDQPDKKSGKSFKLTNYIKKKSMLSSRVTYIIYTDALYHQVVLGQNIFLSKITLEDLRDDFLKFFDVRIDSGDRYNLKLVFDQDSCHARRDVSVRNYYDVVKYLKFDSGQVIE